MNKDLEVIEKQLEALQIEQFKDNQKKIKATNDFLR